MSEPVVAPLNGIDEITDGQARQVVRSPEQVALHLPITGPTTRMLAYGIDCLVILLIEIALVVALFMSTPLLDIVATYFEELQAQIDPAQPFDMGHGGGMFLMVMAVLLVFQFAIESMYFAFSEVLTGGRSLGKALVGLRVVRDGGLALTFEASLVRNLLRIVDMLPSTYALGLVSMVVSSQGKRLGDIAAGTIVVRMDRPLSAPDLTDVPAEVVAAFRFDRAQIGLLGPTERALARQTLRRVESLPPERANEVLDTAVEALRQRIGYGPVAAVERKTFLQALLRATRR